MGNLVCCTLMVPPPMMPKKSSKNKSATIIFPDGQVRQLRGQPLATAAELMFECPNFFLANSKSLHVGRRFTALEADEELEVGNLYIFFPVKRVKSIVGAVDLAPLRLLGACSGSGNDPWGPEEFGEDGSSRDGEDGFEMSDLPEYGHRLSCGSRKPLLETIREEHVWSR